MDRLNGGRKGLMKMATNICGDDIKAAVFGLKIDKVQEKLNSWIRFIYLNEEQWMYQCWSN